MGKQVFGFVSSELGFADINTLETMIASVWSNEIVPVPQNVGLSKVALILIGRGIGFGSEKVVKYTTK